MAPSFFFQCCVGEQDLTAHSMVEELNPTPAEIPVFLEEEVHIIAEEKPTACGQIESVTSTDQLENVASIEEGEAVDRIAMDVISALKHAPSIETSDGGSASAYGTSYASSEGPLDSARDDHKILKLRQFLATAGYRSVNESRSVGVDRIMGRRCYPLHVAVRANDLEAAEALLWAGASNQAISDGNTPEQLARKLDKRGSHSKIIRALSNNVR